MSIIKLMINHIRKIFNSYPSTTKIIVSGVLFSASDYITQIGKLYIIKFFKKYLLILKEI